MNYKRKSPARRKARSEHRHGWSSEGKAQKAKEIKKLITLEIRRNKSGFTRVFGVC